MESDPEVENKLEDFRKALAETKAPRLATPPPVPRYGALFYGGLGAENAKYEPFQNKKLNQGSNTQKDFDEDSEDDLYERILNYPIENEQKNKKKKRKGDNPMSALFNSKSLKVVFAQLDAAWKERGFSDDCARKEKKHWSGLLNCLEKNEKEDQKEAQKRRSRDKKSVDASDVQVAHDQENCQFSSLRVSPRDI